MVKSVETTQAEIHWDPPRGEFTKYTLLFEKVSGSGQPTPSKSISRLTSQTSYANEALGEQDGLNTGMASICILNT